MLHWALEAGDPWQGPHVSLAKTQGHMEESKCSCMYLMAIVAPAKVCLKRARTCIFETSALEVTTKSPTISIQMPKW